MRKGLRHREECRGSHLIFSLTVVMNQGKKIVHTYSYNSFGDSQCILMTCDNTVSLGSLLFSHLNTD